MKLASDKLASVSSGVKELLRKRRLEKRIESVSSGAEAARSQIDELKETLENKEKELESITGDSKTLQKNREEVASKAAEIRLRIVSLQKDVEANTDEITRLKIVRPVTSTVSRSLTEKYAKSKRKTTSSEP